jgi:hypothetical protein
MTTKNKSINLTIYCENISVWIPWSEKRIIRGGMIKILVKTATI